MKRFIFICLMVLILANFACVSIVKNDANPNAIGTIDGSYPNQLSRDKLAGMQSNPGIDNFYPSPPTEDGSLWSENNTSLFSDRKARQVGDSIVVDITEKSSSSLDANTEADRESEVDLGIPNLLGLMSHFQKHNPNLDTSNLVKSDYKNNFAGSGSISRQGEISASIAATVKEVLPNGDLIILGQRELMVNNETQYIKVSGRIRPRDISETNRIASTYIADAKIEYTGQGILANKQKQGWLGTFLDKVWPF